ncbi:MAG: serine/threonine protein kinase [Polyangiaceae bacterium]|nr:serine/threonine protein kinase [Polyangiaceae bacterium]MCW5791373.1 serine/threonine protein kinase [Polyangiaceae bacterium]
MRLRPNPVEALVTLPRLTDADERRASWRQAVAALGRAHRVDGPPPLDGINVGELVAAARIALDRGLADDLDFIAANSRAVALYELSAALPPGAERREFGRRAFAHLYGGTASTFAAVAHRMALGNARPLDTPTLRARVSLVTDLSIGASVNSDPLAFALVARRELFHRWVNLPSTGALPARRLAARLLERAAREAVTRSQQGDPFPKQLLRGPLVRPVFERLLADREPLVWRHAAVARGLLALVEPEVREEVEDALDPELSPTEWRRAAVSLVACLSGDPTQTLKQCRALLQGPIVTADPGLVATMVWGLPCVIEAEPDAAEELLDWLTATLRLDVAEASVELLRDTSNLEFGARAEEIVRGVLDEKMRSSDPVTGYIAHRALNDLAQDVDAEGGLLQSERRALVAFETKGARIAHELALEAVARAASAMDRIVRLAPSGEVVAETFPPLLTLDVGALERSRLSDLLLLGRRPGETDATVPELDQLYDRLGRWLLEGEQKNEPLEEDRASIVGTQRRLRTLLHLVDLDTAARDQLEEVASRVRNRVRDTLRLLIQQVKTCPPSLHRITCATLARCFDAAVREGVADPSDLFLVLTRELGDHQSVAAIAEASTSEDVVGPANAWATFLNRSGGGRVHSLSEAQFQSALEGREARQAELARAVVELARAASASGSYRGEALRQVVLRIGRSLESIAAARGLSEIVDAAGGNNAIADLELAIDALRRLSAAASERLLDQSGSNNQISIIADVPPLSSLIERAVTAGIPANKAQLMMATTELSAELPSALAEAVSVVLARVGELPVAPPSDVYTIPLQKRREALPDWLMPRRTIGGFYVVRALGAGGVSSVFVARRVEERHANKAEVFALKVPEYDPNTARSISEQEFLQLFREEAGALLALPSHPNLARFVTFDLAARPKPILVMELIRGFSLDRMIRSRSLTTERALGYLDGILAGLSAMHAAGVGHLDLKPGNVILRDGHEPVLVDFGLSGRQLRPGCGTLEYCAPEILGVVPPGATPTPQAADMYAFACTAYEILTAITLFEGDDEMALASAHVNHDGWPEHIAELGQVSQLTQLMTILAACLRRDPRHRPSAQETRDALSSLTPSLSRLPWPLAAPAAAATA